MMSGRRKVLLRGAIAVLVLFVLRPEAQAQLNDSCTVSAFNRTAPVQADGVWVLPNVPAGAGQVRVRATCLEDGLLRFGQSGLITVPVDGVVKVDQIDFTAPVAIPTSLALSAPSVQLTAMGETMQLTVLATYPGGSTGDVTPADRGTNYRTSNPSIATVDAAGLVTARASGVALLSAVNEGALGILRIQVVTSGDSDGDGLPDDWELAHGLDPNNPVDALADPDGDGLATITEYQSGLNPFNGDSDGDGLLDGREVNDLQTNPLLADTDGDGLRDGLEMQTGSDPLDPNSFNLAAALQSIEVSPGSFDLVFNTILGEASRQLRVAGRLIDGTSLDVTSRRYGTAYGSSDLQVASFGPEDGRVYAGIDGQATVTGQVGGRSANTQARVRTFAPQALSFLPLPGFANGVAVSGDHAYVAIGATGLQVVDVSNPLLPAIVGTLDTPGNANDVRVVGDTVYVADGRSGLVIVDIRQKNAPRILGKTTVAGNATDLAVSGSRVYVADELGLSIVDVSNPAEPLMLGFVATPGRARGVDVADDLALVAATSAGLQVIDVSDPQNPVIVGETATRPDGSSSASDVVVRERLAYVTDGADGHVGGLRVIDFRDPTNPVVVGSTADGVGLTAVALERGLVLASDYTYANAVPIFDAAPENPIFRGILDFSGEPGFRDDQGNGVAVQDGYVYLAATSCCTVKDNGSTGSGALHIGRYAIFEDVDPDGVAPAVTLTAPAAGASIKERRTLALAAEARDDFQVESVRFTVNGQTVFTDYSKPYAFSYRVPSGAAPELRAGAIATDFSGNQGAAQEARVTVEADDPEPVVALLAPGAGQVVTEGTLLTLAAQASDDQAVVQVDFLVDGVLRRSDTAAPYRFDYLVPLGATQLSVSAVARDATGPSVPAGPVTVLVRPDEHPTASVLAPRDGEQVVEGSPLEILAGATDDVGLRRVEVYVDGVRIVSLGSPPYRWTVSAPPAGESLRIHAIAEDTRLRRVTSPAVTVTGVPDPLTAIHGRVIDAAGAPVPGAWIEAADLSVLSAADGSFLLGGLPSNAGDLFLSAAAVIEGFELHGSLDEGIAPVPGGVMEVGDVELTRDDPGTTLTGRTVDAAGSPVAGAQVKVYDDVSVFTAASGPDGRFFVPGVPALASLTVSASATVAGTKLRGSMNAYPGGEETTDAGDLLLEVVEEIPDALTTVTGRVIEPTANGPVAGARVNVFTSFDVYSTLTAVDGSFSLTGVPTVDGDLSVAASAVIEGTLWSGRSFATPEPGGTADLGNLTIYPGGGGGVFLLEPEFLVPRASGVRLALRGAGPVCSGER